MAEDNRRLIPMTIKHLDGDKWMISIENGESYSVKGDFDSIKKVIRRIKGKDGENKDKCRSAKVGTYASMISADDNTEHKINVWKSKVPHNAEEFKKLMEKMNMKGLKSVKITKNYLIEGNIIPKGTVVYLREESDNELKEEEIGFLPTDVWEKAKDIEDETERFEYVKKEIGNEFTDEEIETFLVKYKTDLNKKDIKKIKKFSNEDSNDMVSVIKDTIEFEKIVDKNKIDDLIDECKKNKDLTRAWEILMVANEKTFRTKENAFWKIFDKICKEYKDKNKEKDVA